MLLAVAAVANEVNHDVLAASATCARDAKGRCIEFACDDCFLHPPDRLHALYMRSLPSRYLVANSTHGSEKVASKRTSDMCACTRKAAFHLPNCSRAVYTRLALPRIAAAMVAELHAIFPAVKYEGERCAADRLHATVDPS